MIIADKGGGDFKVLDWEDSMNQPAERVTVRRQEEFTDEDRAIFEGKSPPRGQGPSAPASASRGTSLSSTPQNRTSLPVEGASQPSMKRGDTRKGYVPYKSKALPRATPYEGGPDRYAQPQQQPKPYKGGPDRLGNIRGQDVTNAVQQVNASPWMRSLPQGAIQPEATYIDTTSQYPMAQGWMGQNMDYSRFGWPGHLGVDYSMPEGTEVKSPYAGQIVVVGSDPGGYGEYVTVAYPQGTGYYGHLSQPMVQAGQQIAPGGVLGLSGNTGNSTAPHLHFGLRTENTEDQYKGYVDPSGFLSGQYR